MQRRNRFASRQTSIANEEKKYRQDVHIILFLKSFTADNALRKFWCKLKGEKNTWLDDLECREKIEK